MNLSSKLISIIALIAMFGCATSPNGGGSTSSSSGTSSSAQSKGSGSAKKMLTEDDYKRIGIKETAGN